MKMTDLEKDLVIKQLKEQLESYKAENTDLKQQLAFLEGWRDVWAPVIRQHQGVD